MHKVINPTAKNSRTALKKTRYILISSRKTLKSKDVDVKDGRPIHKGNSLFKTDSIVRETG